jgi:hypothetical protein
MPAVVKMVFVGSPRNSHILRSFGAPSPFTIPGIRSYARPLVRGGLPLVFIDTVSVVPRMWAVRSAQNVGDAWVEESSRIRIANTRVVFVVDPLFIDGYIRLCYQSALAPESAAWIRSCRRGGQPRDALVSLLVRCLDGYEDDVRVLDQLAHIFGEPQPTGLQDGFDRGFAIRPRFLVGGSAPSATPGD